MDRVQALRSLYNKQSWFPVDGFDVGLGSALVFFNMRSQYKVVVSMGGIQTEDTFNALYSDPGMPATRELELARGLAEELASELILVPSD